jgi:hypothetical protein
VPFRWKSGKIGSAQPLRAIRVRDDLMLTRAANSGTVCRLDVDFFVPEGRVMGHLAGVWHALGVKSTRNNVLFGALCGVVAATAGSLCWLAFRGPSETPRAIIGVGVHSNAGLVGAVATDPDGLPLAPVPLHKRTDYRVEPPDILSIQFTAASANSQDEEMRATGGEKLVQPDGTIKLGNEFGSLLVAGLTMSEIETAIEERVNAPGRSWRARVSVHAQNSEVYYLIVEGDASHSTEVQRHTVVGADEASRKATRSLTTSPGKAFPGL